MSVEITTSEDAITKFSVIIPCFNEEKTLRKCIEKVLEIADETLSLQLIIVDDCSKDRGLMNFA